MRGGTEERGKRRKQRDKGSVGKRPRKRRGTLLKKERNETRGPEPGAGSQIGNATSDHIGRESGRGRGEEAGDLSVQSMRFYLAHVLSCSVVVHLYIHSSFYILVPTIKGKGNRVIDEGIVPCAFCLGFPQRMYMRESFVHRTFLDLKP